MRGLTTGCSGRLLRGPPLNRDVSETAKTSMTADTITLAVSDATSAQSPHEKLAAALGFPDYYGKNWDAFWDCIRDPDQATMPQRLVIQGFGVLRERLPREADLLRSRLLDHQRGKLGFEVLFE